jgi:hypothetical protein
MYFLFIIVTDVNIDFDESSRKYSHGRKHQRSTRPKNSNTSWGTPIKSEQSCVCTFNFDPTKLQLDDIEARCSPKGETSPVVRSGFEITNVLECHEELVEQPLSFEFFKSADFTLTDASGCPTPTKISSSQPALDVTLLKQSLTKAIICNRLLIQPHLKTLLDILTLMLLMICTVKYIHVIYPCSNKLLIPGFMI